MQFVRHSGIILCFVCLKIISYQTLCGLDCWARVGEVVHISSRISARTLLRSLEWLHSNFWPFLKLQMVLKLCLRAKSAVCRRLANIGCINNELRLANLEFKLKPSQSSDCVTRKSLDIKRFLEYKIAAFLSFERLRRKPWESPEA